MSAAARVISIDLIRGAVMVLMAIDHVRVYAGLPAGGPTPGIFFTRWVTHFCAPAFIFIAGTSAFFFASRRADEGSEDGSAALSRFLLVRGAWLVLLELTVIRLTWTFNADFHFMMAGVIWAIGWSMIVLSLLVRLPIAIVAAFGVVIIAAHNAVGPLIPSTFPALGAGLSWLWKILYLGPYEGPVELGGGFRLIVLYSLVPWVGVVAAGYAFGRVLVLELRRRDRLCLAIGLSAVVLFFVLRGFDAYGDPQPWRDSWLPPPLAFLETTKYPASLSFLLMTLGPAIALIPLLERAHGRLAEVIAVFGRVPFFYYVLHIPLIHALAIVVSLVRTGEVSSWLFANHPMGSGPPPDGYAWSLALLYVVWAVAVALLYPACRWFATLKRRRSEWWMRYL